MQKFIQQNWSPQAPYCIYMHTSPSGKVYIGQTKKKYLNDRWGAGEGYKSCKAFYRAIKKYGWNDIKHEILFEGLTKEHADQIEISLISKYKALGKCYNIMSGGGNCVIGYTDERRQKIIMANSGRKYIHKGGVEKRIKIDNLEQYINDGWELGRRDGWKQQCRDVLRKNGHPLKGKQQTPEHREKNRLGHLGQKPTQYQLQRISEACKGRISPTKGCILINNGSINKCISAELFEQYLMRGWVKGIIRSGIKNKL